MDRYLTKYTEFQNQLKYPFFLGENIFAEIDYLQSKYDNGYIFTQNDFDFDFVS